MNKNEYVPGVCNIGNAEISNRKLIGWVGLVITIVLWILFSYLNLSAGTYLILFFPAFASSIGFTQAYSHFCVHFGMRGLFNFDSEIGKTKTIEQKEFRVKDRIQAVKILIYAMLISLIVTIIAFYSAT